MSKQRVYSAEGTPLNFLDTNRSRRQAAVRYSREIERGEKEREGREEGREDREEGREDREAGRERERKICLSSIIEYIIQIIDCLLLSIVFARAHMKKRKNGYKIVCACPCKLYYYTVRLIAKGFLLRFLVARSCT